ncbi:hypothetical protein [Paraglaciecola sp. 20A4]|uniref:hypothetical protein n=1 Tax=Paraglaciecola sp. 20A4 TaxID=2687288 RepID=UPI00140CC0AA|nr:hypothetical protein [Paraglaciecola sp. 20A4]
MKVFSKLWILGALLGICGVANTAEKPLPDTGVSGVYEVMIGTDDSEKLLKYLAEFGFQQIDKGQLGQDKARSLYGVDSALTSYRLQNGDTDSHGLIRVLEWQSLLGDGVGYAQPETVGQRMMVMRTNDVHRIHDVFADARKAGQKWLPTKPVYADLYGMTKGKPDVLKRRTGVREMAVYGDLFNLVLFQRYGYVIKGYGSITAQSPLKTSEITHNDFILAGSTKEDMNRQTDYYRDVFGLKPEGPVVLDGDWQDGPKVVFNMADGSSHYYRGFVSPNNISGKLKFFVNPDARPDRSALQKPGYAGITLHSLYAVDPKLIKRLADEQGITSSAMQNNEFGESSFVLRGPDGSSWQILPKPTLVTPPVTELKFETTIH